MVFEILLNSCHEFKNQYPKIILENEIQYYYRWSDIQYINNPENEEIVQYCEKTLCDEYVSSFLDCLES